MPARPTGHGVAALRMTAGRRKRWLKTGAPALVVLAALYSMLRWFEYSQVYHPTRELEASPAGLGMAFEEARFQASDGVALHGWFFPAGSDSPRRARSLLVCHGNGGNISHRLGLCAALRKTGAGVFIYDYRGYGQSGGRPSEEGTYRDAQAAYVWLRQKGFAAHHIIGFGESLGGAVATELAVREATGGLVLESTFTSVPDLGVELFPWLPVRWLSTIQYDTRRKLPRIRVPVLVMHSRGDGLIPFHHATENFAAANEPKAFGELRGDHNDPVYDEPAFTGALEPFLQRIETRPTP